MRWCKRFWNRLRAISARGYLRPEHGVQPLRQVLQVCDLLNFVLCNLYFVTDFLNVMVEELKIYKDASELINRVFIFVKQFPREYKFTLGTQIQNTALDF